jgi:DNA repair protein SbcC/Rad50
MKDLISLTIEGFRGFSSKKKLDLGGSLILLFGENRTGKSSTLNALEWVLYGKECVGVATGMRERVGWEIANRYAAPQNVRVVADFLDNGVSYRVIRSLDPSAGRKGERLQLDLPNAMLVGDEAEARLSSDVAYSFRDFATTVYQHQEAIRAVVTQEPGERNDALDRLLGLSDYRSLLTAIDKAKLAQEFKEASAQEDNIAHDIETALRLRERDLTGLEDRAKDIGLTKSDLTAEGALKHSGQLVRDFTQFTVESGLTGFQLASPIIINDVGDFTRRTHQLLGEARGGIPLFKIQEELLNRRATVARWQNQLRGLKEQAEEQDSRALEYNTRYVSIAAIKSELETLASTETDRRERLSQINRKAPLVKEALSFLASGFAGVCPLCNKPEPGLLNHLESEWEALVNIETKDIEAFLNQVRTRRQELSTALPNWQGAIDSAAEIEGQLSTLKENVKGSLDADLNGSELGDWLNGDLQRIEDHLRTTEQAVKEKIQKIDALETCLSQIETISEYLRLHEKIEALNAVNESSEFQILQQQLSEIAQLVVNIDQIKKAIISSSNEEAQSKINLASNAIDKIFRQTAVRQAITRVELKVEADHRTGRNAYSFVDEDNRDLMPILSQGDMNCLALSIFLGLASTATHASPFGFLLLDDPSQSLGSKEKKALADVLANISQTMSVIVATMDSELRDILVNGHSNTKLLVYHFRDWTPEQGSLIEIAGRR